MRNAVTLILIPARPGEALGAGNALGAPPVFYRHALKASLFSLTVAIMWRGIQ